MAPFTRFGDCGDIGRALPKSLKQLGHEVRVVTPRYAHIRERQHGLRDVARLRSIPIKYGDVDDMCTVKSGFIPGSRVQTYFIDNKAWFNEAGFKNKNIDGKGWAKITGQLQYFSHVSLQLTLLLQWVPDIIHCNWWQTSFVPYLLRHDPLYMEDFITTRTIFQLGTDDLDFVLDNTKSIPDLAEGDESDIPDPLSSRLAYITSGLASIDCLVNVTPLNTIKLEMPRLKSASEDKTDLFKVEWNPADDPDIACNYSMKDFVDGKAKNKKALLKQLGFKDSTDLPLVAIAPSAVQKSKAVMLTELGEALTDLEALFVILPTGDKEVDDLCRQMAESSPDTIKMASELSDQIKHLTLAGADMLIMPSPCSSLGFHQADAMLYGTVPVAGMVDDKVEAVEPYNSKGKGSGFIFTDGDGEHLIRMLEKAIGVFADKKVWQLMQKRGICGDFSWGSAACKLVTLYEKSLDKPPVVEI